jgi:hypothetical protein
MNKHILGIFAAYALTTSALLAQNAPFQITIEPVSIPDLIGVQAFAWGQHNGKWLIVGGRLDGLHRRQPFASFDLQGNNNQLIVIDPVAKKKWSTSLTTLSSSIQEQLSSTNMEFYQGNEMLYIVGGYGYSPTAANHITFPYMSAIHVSDVIDAVVNGNSIASSIRQITDTMFAVTGGYLNKINSTFYLTGGQKFTGRYNPMGPTHGPGFAQAYTNAVRKFSVSDDGINLTVTHLTSIIDPTNLHRRDYNVVAQIFPDGQEGLTAFSGVFQANLDLPYLNSVNIDSSAYQVNKNFAQYYNHYHCAHIPLYSPSTKEMHTLFFGGIAQYYDSAGVLVQDNNVPFVKTIARVTRNANGEMKEYKLPVEMPSFLGASSEFIPAESVPLYNTDILNLDAMQDDSILIGYVFGGISSSAANIFFINTGLESVASNQLYKVYLLKNKNSSIDVLNSQSNGSFKMQVYSNPNNGKFLVKFNMKTMESVFLSIFDANGRLIERIELRDLQMGENTFVKQIEAIEQSSIFFIQLEIAREKAIQKIVLER